MKSLFLAFSLILTAACASAQDKIFTTTQKNPIEGEVVEIATSEIRYKPTGRPNPITSIDKQDVVKIVYANGEVFMINNPLKDYSVYSGQHKWDIKLDLLSPVLGYTNLYLEHSLKPGRSVEYQLNLIGLGKDQMLTSGNNGNYVGDATFEAKGVGLGVGMKFLRLPDYVNGQVRLRHILQGSYMKPAISLSYYERNFMGLDASGNSTLERKPVFAVNPNVTFGRQFILDNTFSIEFYASIGFSVDNVRSHEEEVRKDYQSPYYYNYQSNEPFNGFGYTRFSSGDLGLTLAAGLRVGYLFDFKKQSKTPIR
jgi:hypothetical protein